MVDWPPSRVVVYHDNAPPVVEPAFRMSEYLVNRDLALRSGWPILPVAKELGSDSIALNVIVSGREFAVAGARFRYAYFPQDDEVCVMTVSFPGFDLNGSFEAGTEGIRVGLRCFSSVTR